MKNAVISIVLKLIKLVSFVFFPCKCIGFENFPKDRSFLICSNHISAFDIVPIYITYGKAMKIMAKKELFKNKFIGSVLKFFGAFAVDRGTGDKSAINFAEETLKSNSPVCIFVEGTRTKDPECRPGKAKSGAALIASGSGCDVVPVAIVYKHKRPRIFAPCKVVVGECISNAELKIDNNSRSDLRRITNTIMSKIVFLWEREQFNA